MIELREANGEICLCCGGMFGQGKGSDYCSEPFVGPVCILFDPRHGRCWALKKHREGYGNCKGAYRFDWRGLTEWGLTTA